MADAETGNLRSVGILVLLFLLYALRFFLICRLPLAPDEAFYRYRDNGSSVPAIDTWDSTSRVPVDIPFFRGFPFNGMSFYILLGKDLRGNRRLRV